LLEAILESLKKDIPVETSLHYEMFVEDFMPRCEISITELPCKVNTLSTLGPFLV
jgi:hypothetical protein